MQINITDIQHFSVGDGDGIRSTVFFKGCNLHCLWCHNPETISKEAQTLCYKNKSPETVGKKVSLENVVRELLEDKPFYISSGGGVTLSGGECMLQADAVSRLASLLKNEGVSTLVDTAGYVSYSSFEKTNGIVAGYLYDFKSANEEKLKKYTGAELGVVYSNLKKLLSDGQKVFIRIPLIPDFNTDEDEIEAISCLLEKAGVKEVYLLPFHRLGAGKYTALGMDYAYKDTEPLSKEEIARIASQYEKKFKVIIEK